METRLLSKRSEQFLPDYWPSYYKKAKGIEVWDLDGNHFYDMSIMGIGTCPLGYADDDVDKAVKSVIDNGSMCTLNCPDEVELAEVFHPAPPLGGDGTLREVWWRSYGNSNPYRPGKNRKG